MHPGRTGPHTQAHEHTNTHAREPAHLSTQRHSTLPLHTRTAPLVRKGSGVPRHLVKHKQSQCSEHTWAAKQTMPTILQQTLRIGHCVAQAWFPPLTLIKDSRTSGRYPDSCFMRTSILSIRVASLLSRITQHTFMYNAFNLLLHPRCAPALFLRIQHVYQHLFLRI